MHSFLCNDAKPPEKEFNTYVMNDDVLRLLPSLHLGRRCEMFDEGFGAIGSAPFRAQKRREELLWLCSQRN